MTGMDEQTNFLIVTDPDTARIGASVIDEVKAGMHLLSQLFLRCDLFVVHVHLRAIISVSQRYNGGDPTHRAAL